MGRAAISISVAAAVLLAVLAANWSGGRDAGAQPADLVPLSTGCNNVASTWPTGTSTAVIAAAVDPGANLIAIWFFVGAQQRFVGFSPLPGAPSDLLTVGRLDPLFFCMSGPGIVNRAPIAGTAPTPAPTAAPTVAPTQVPITMPSGCCRVCTTGQACGNSCIAAGLNCRQPPGCACNARIELDGAGEPIVVITRADTSQFFLPADTWNDMLDLGADCALLQEVLALVSEN